METHACGSVSRRKCGVGIMHIPVPPIEKLVGCSLSFRRVVLLKEVDDKFIEFFIVEPIILAFPVGGIVERKVKLA